MGEGTINLIDDRDVSAVLVGNPDAWRVRVVEEITIDAATHCLRRRSLQAAPLRELLASHITDPAATEALLALNVARIPRGPLMDFDVEGPKGDAWLLPRTEIAPRQALRLVNLASDAGLTVGKEQQELLGAILGFTGSRWFVGREVVPFSDYIQDGLGRSVPPLTLADWQAVGQHCRQILRPHLDVFQGYSAPENPALALPALFAQGLLENDETASRWLWEYAAMLDAVEALANEDSMVAYTASEFLGALADYANNYDLMVALRVPLDEPFLVKYSERRSLELSAFRNQGTQQLVIADAHTNHVTFKVTDPSVRIADFEAYKPSGDGFADGAFLSRSDDQTRTFYAYDERDFRIRLTFRLAFLRRLQIVPYSVALLLFGVATVLLVERPSDLRTVALVVGPSALAASVLLAREPSTLGSRLRLLSSIVLGAALLVVVGAVLYLYVHGLLVR